MTSPCSFLVLLAGAAALSVLAAANDRLPGDLWIVSQAQNAGGWFDPVAKAARTVTSTQTVLALGAVLTVVMFLRGEPRLGVFAVAVLITLPLLQAGIKNVVDRPRPDAALVERRDVFTSESFPSGHTMSGTVLLALAIVALVAVVPHRQLRAAGIALGCAVLAVSMMGDLYLGMHWPSDVLGGVLWAGVLVIGAWTAVRRVSPAAIRENWRR